MREQFGYQYLAVRFEDFPIGPGAQGYVVRRNAGKHLLEPFFEGDADGCGDRVLVGLCVSQALQRLPHREHDVGPGIAERAVEVEDDQVQVLVVGSHGC